jgi:hypothetical protein
LREGRNHRGRSTYGEERASFHSGSGYHSYNLSMDSRRRALLVAGLGMYAGNIFFPQSKVTLPKIGLGYLADLRRRRRAHRARPAPGSSQSS